MDIKYILRIINGAGGFHSHLVLFILKENYGMQKKEQKTMI